MSGIYCLILLTLTLNAECTLSPKNRHGKAGTTKLLNVRAGPQETTVFQKGLVQPEPTAKEILQHHQSYYQEPDDHRVNGLVLGFVTPWNNHGYDIAKMFGNKFTHISPVWYEIKPDDDGKYEVSGKQNLNEKWVAHVRNAGRERGVKIVPRVLFGGWSITDYQQLFKNKKEITALAKTLINLSKEGNFGGYVIEMWAQVTGHFAEDTLVNFVITLADKLANNGLETILVVPPKRGVRSGFTETQFDKLYTHVSAFVLMSYDYSGPHKPGPNAPLKWIEEAILDVSSDEKKRSRILTGLNFYGMWYAPQSAQPIVGHEYVKKLKDYNEKLKYDFYTAENYLEYEESNGKHLIFYPSLYSIEKRLNLTRDLCTGVSIWELGQGLDYFYDLL